MHEFSICRSLISQVEEVARSRRAAAVTAVVVGIGPLSGIHAHELHYAFPIVSAGTLAHRARLDVRHRPLRWRCRDCGTEAESDAAQARCPACRGEDVQLLGGDQIILERVEVTR